MATNAVNLSRRQRKGWVNLLKKGLPGLFFFRSTTSRPIQKTQGSSQAESRSLVRPAPRPHQVLPLSGSRSWEAAAADVRVAAGVDGAERSPRGRGSRAPPAASVPAHSDIPAAPQPGAEPRPRRPHSPLPAARNPQRGVRNPERTTRSTEPGTHSPERTARNTERSSLRGRLARAPLFQNGSLQRTLLVSGLTELLVAGAGGDGGRA